ncbi:hypothetical protein ACGFNU_39920 [Spirillospora sp. NPDC048911]|uniref:hypothetical protein n=1 Tax=Spirillospora sp. NPDC048911 TaxID=3364527 RepID=UPI003719F152
MVGIVSAIRYAALAVIALQAFKHVRNSHGGATTTMNDESGPGTRCRIGHPGLTGPEPILTAACR